MPAQVSGKQQPGNIEGLQPQHPLRGIDCIVVLAESHVRASEISTNGGIIRGLLLQFRGFIVCPRKIALFQQESHVRFAQLKIPWGETEAGGDGLRCLAIIIGRRGFLRPAEESQGQIVVAFRTFGIGCDLLPGGCDPLLGGSHLMDLRRA